MTKHEIKIRRGVFRSGAIKSSRDFKRFEKHYRDRKRSENRMRIIIVMIIIILITSFLVFTLRARPLRGVLNKAVTKTECITINPGL